MIFNIFKVMIHSISQSKLQNAQCIKQYCNKNNSIKLKNTVLIQENKKNKKT